MPPNTVTNIILEIALCNSSKLPFLPIVYDKKEVAAIDKPDPKAFTIIKSIV